MIPIPNQVGSLSRQARRCATLCWEDVTDPSFSHAVVFIPNSLIFATDPRVVELVTGLKHYQVGQAQRDLA